MTNFFKNHADMTNAEFKKSSDRNVKIMKS